MKANIGDKVRVYLEKMDCDGIGVLTEYQTILTFVNKKEVERQYPVVRVEKLKGKNKDKFWIEHLKKYKYLHAIVGEEDILKIIKRK